MGFFFKFLIFFFLKKIISSCSVTKGECENLRQKVKEFVDDVNGQNEIFMSVKALHTEFSCNRVKWKQKLSFYQKATQNSSPLKIPTGKKIEITYSSFSKHANSSPTNMLLRRRDSF